MYALLKWRLCVILVFLHLPHTNVDHVDLYPYIHAFGAAVLCDAVAGVPSRLRASLSRKAATALSAAAGPDYSSWEALWTSLGAMAPKRMLPLLQVSVVLQHSRGVF